MSEKRAFGLFVLIGGFAAAMNFAARLLIDRWTSYEMAIFLAYLVGLSTAFVLNRILLFKPVDTQWRGEFVRFTLVNLLALLQIFAVSELLFRVIFPAIGMTFHPETVAHAIGLASPVFVSYWAHKHFTFKTGPAGRAETGQPQ